MVGKLQKVGQLHVSVLTKGIQWILSWASSVHSTPSPQNISKIHFSMSLHSMYVFSNGNFLLKGLKQRNIKVYSIKFISICLVEIAYCRTNLHLARILHGGCLVQNHWLIWSVFCSYFRRLVENEIWRFIIRFEVLTAVIMKSIILWDVTPCSPLKSKPMSTCTSETSVDF
jgi:hypothetical protein